MDPHELDFIKELGKIKERVNEAVVGYNNEKYILVLLSKNLEDDIEGADFLAKISLEIYNFLS